MYLTSLKIRQKGEGSANWDPKIAAQTETALPSTFTLERANGTALRGSNLQPLGCRMRRRRRRLRSKPFVKPHPGKRQQSIPILAKRLHAASAASSTNITFTRRSSSRIGIPIPRIHKIQQHEIRPSPTIQSQTPLHLLPHVIPRVRVPRPQPVRDLDPTRHLHVKEMIDDVHAAVGRGGAGAIDAAVWEVRVGDAEGGFEEVGEFGEDVGEAFGLGSGIWSHGGGLDGIKEVRFDWLRRKRASASESPPTHEYDQSFSCPYDVS